MKHWPNRFFFFFLSLCILFPTEVAPTEPPQLPGNCPESKKQRPWMPFRGHCYAFLSSRVDNWAQASVECLKMGKYYVSCFWYITSLCINYNTMSMGLSGASLVSIQDPVEETFIQQTIELLQDSAKSFWIGLYKSHDGKNNEVKFWLCVFTNTSYILWSLDLIWKHIWNNMTRTTSCHQFYDREDMSC